MRNGFLATALVLILASAFWISVPVGCANIVPPSGGPRDSIPPVLEKATPVDSSVNVTGKTLTFTFDEEIDLRDPNSIIFTPVSDVRPTVTAKGRTVTVKFDTLEKNTTYIINFGNSIVDFTEGNPLKDLTYVFSTGPQLDSLEITGKVVMAENGSIDSTLIVVLHKDLRDSAVTRSPQYVVRLDRNGNFRFHNLPNTSFAIYAIGNAETSRRYQTPTTQAFAFYDSPVAAGTDSIVLYAYKEAANTPQPTTSGNTRTSNQDRRLRFTTVTTGQQDLLTDYILNFPVPLRSFDSTKLHLSTDTLFTPASFHSILDSSKKELRLQTNWQEGVRYNLILEKDFATDTAGRQLLKTDTLSFVTKKKSDYGSLSLRIRNLESYKNPVLQFVQNNQVVLSVPIKSGVYNQTLFLPGDYSLRVFDDVNGNGKWDPGHFFGQKRQPEIVRPIDQPITIKANWDNEFERVL